MGEADAPGPAGDASGTVTIFERGRSGLYADDLGVTVRRSKSRADRFAWSEISRFADGAGREDAGPYWLLQIVLQTGRNVPVGCTARSPAPELLAVVRQVAQRHGIPADVTGIPTTDGRPPQPGIYEDPGGEPGSRYWDGTQWSPLLPPGVSKRAAERSAASWSALPIAYGRWTYAAAAARRATRFFVLLAVLSAALLAAGLLIELRWDRGAHPMHWSGRPWFLGCWIAAIPAVAAWTGRRKFRRLDAAANTRLWSGPGGWSPMLRPDPPAGEPGSGQVSMARAEVWSPLPGSGHQRQLVAARARRAGIRSVGWLAAAAAAMLASAVLFSRYSVRPHADYTVPALFFWVAVCCACGALAGWVKRAEDQKIYQAGRSAAGLPQLTCAQCGAEVGEAERVCARCGAAPGARQWSSAGPAAEMPAEDLVNAPAAAGDDAGSAPARARVRQVALALVPVVSLTALASAPFLWRALIRRRGQDWAVFSAYAVATAVAAGCFLVAAASPGHNSASGVFGALILWAVLIVAPVHVLVAFRPAAPVPSWRAAHAARVAGEHSARYNQRS